MIEIEKSDKEFRKKLNVDLYTKLDWGLYSEIYDDLFWVLYSELWSELDEELKNELNF